MSEEKSLKCVEPVGGVTAAQPASADTIGDGSLQKGETRVLARVGREAPDFEARALIAGQFKNVKLSDYRGKWVLLCFYPGDFTFV